MSYLLYFFIGLVAIAAALSFVFTVGLLTRRLLEGKFVTDWDTFAGGVVVLFLLAVAVALCCSVGYGLVHHSWN